MLYQPLDALQRGRFAMLIEISVSLILCIK